MQCPVGIHRHVAGRRWQIHWLLAERDRMGCRGVLIPPLHRLPRVNHPRVVHESHDGQRVRSPGRGGYLPNAGCYMVVSVTVLGPVTAVGLVATFKARSDLNQQLLVRLRAMAVRAVQPLVKPAARDTEAAHISRVCHTRCFAMNSIVTAVPSRSRQRLFKNVSLGLGVRQLASEPGNLCIVRSLLAATWKRRRTVGLGILAPFPQYVLVQPQIPRCLGDRYAPIADQPYTASTLNSSVKLRLGVRKIVGRSQRPLALQARRA